MQNGEQLQALDDFATAVRRDPENSDIYHHRGQVSGERFLYLSTTYVGSRLHGQNRENGNKNLSGKHREFRNFPKTQGIWFAQVVNFLIIRVKDISIFAANNIQFLFRLDKSAKLVLCV